MIFCPKCEQEFPDTAPTWSDCNIEFVSSLKEDELPPRLNEGSSLG